VPIIEQGGVEVGPTEFIMPDPILVGRNPVKLEKLAARSGVEKWSTDLDAVLADPDYTLYFDAQTTDRRVAAVKQAIAAGKDIYVEKPTATNTAGALDLYETATKAGVKNGVVQDKLWLPGLLKLRNLMRKGFFGQILSVRGEFGYWVFEGDTVPAQRPSWNYRKEDGGGIIIDMLCHWRYVLDNLFGAVKSVSCLGATHVPERVDESGKPYACTADDSAYATFELEGGVIAHFNSSWCVRVRRDDLLTLQVDGTLGSAVAGLRDCWVQPYGATPRPVWNPDIEQPVKFMEGWARLPDQQDYQNAFKLQWELFLKYVALDEPFRWSLLEGAKGVQLAEKGIESWQKRAWVDVPSLTG
jgi:predicted dehydrogenase